MKRTLLLALVTAVFTATGAPARADTPTTMATRSTWGASCAHGPREERATRTAPVLGALALVVAPYVIDAAVDHLAAAVQAASGPKEMQFHAASNLLSFYEITKSGEMRLSREARCFTLVRGRFGPGRGEDKATDKGNGNDPNKDKDKDKGKDTSELSGLVQTDFRFEAKVVPIQGTKYFQLVPQYFEAARLEPASLFSSTGTYAVSLNLSAAGEAKPFASATFVFEGVKEGTVIQGSDPRLAAAASDPLPYPGDLKDAVAARDRQAKAIAPTLVALAILEGPKPSMPRPLEIDDPSVSGPLAAYCDARRKLNEELPSGLRQYDARCDVQLNCLTKMLNEALAKAFFSPESVKWAKAMCPKQKACEDAVAGNEAIEGPGSGLFLAKAILTETRDASRFGQELAALLGAASGDIKKALKDQLPDARAAAREAADAQSREARQAVVFADLEVQKAEANLQRVSEESSDKTAILGAQLELVKMRIAANTAYRKAGLPVPYPEYD